MAWAGACLPLPLGDTQGTINLPAPTQSEHVTFCPSPHVTRMKELGIIYSVTTNLLSEKKKIPELKFS
jgi:predicted amidohydrolase YtcJ